jgi:hypothetical protein
MHFVYDWSGGLSLVAVVAPVNESIAEHLKLIFYPMVLYFVVVYFIKVDKCAISAGKWFFSLLVSTITGMLAVCLLYYFYIGAFGVNIDFINIGIYYVSVILGLSSGASVYGKVKNTSPFISIFILLIIAFALTYFTYYPPALPIFMDPVSKKYGIEVFIYSSF